MRIAEARLAVIDTEGDLEVEYGIASVGSILFDGNDDQPWASQDAFEFQVKPPKPIRCGPGGIHWILDEELAQKPTLDECAPEIRDRLNGAVLIAHNGQNHDSKFLPFLAGSRWIDTLRLARHLWDAAPELSDFRNGTLCWWLRGAPLVKPFLSRAHDAVSDCRITAYVARRAIDTYLKLGYPDDIDALVEFAASPIIYKLCPFKKYRNRPWDEVPADYMRWCLKNMEDLDDDLRRTIEYHLALWDAGWKPVRKAA